MEILDNFQNIKTPLRKMVSNTKINPNQGRLFHIPNVYKG